MHLASANPRDSLTPSRPTSRRLHLALASLALSLCGAGPLQAAEPAVPAPLQRLITLHYKGYSAGEDAAAIFAQTTSPQWRSCGDNGRDCLGREGLAPALAGLKQAVPDLKWEIVEVIRQGNRIIVRGQGSGTPVGEFMGTPAAGKRFRIMSIDIHTVQAGRIILTHHLEDWAGAIQQLRGGK